MPEPTLLTKRLLRLQGYPKTQAEYTKNRKRCAEALLSLMGEAGKSKMNKVRIGRDCPRNRRRSPPPSSQRQAAEDRPAAVTAARRRRR